MKEVNKKLMEKFSNDKQKGKVREDLIARNDDYNKRKEASKQYTQVSLIHKKHKKLKEDIISKNKKM